MNKTLLSLKTKIYLLLALLILSFNLKAQLNIQFNGVNEYLFNSSQVLNFTAINSNSKSYQVYFIGKIKDQNNDIVLEYKTTNVSLNVGANMFSKFNISFSELRFLNSDILEVEEKSGVFPYGAYQICMYAQCVEANCGNVSNNIGGMETPECINIKVETPTPLLLAYPENESEIEVTRPMYLWIPPSPIASSSQLNYKMRLVEIMDGQSKSDALTMNRPLIEESGILKPSLMHSLDVAELEKDKWYAWEVEAYVGHTFITRSEQWKFKVKKEDKKIEVFRYFNINQENSEITKVRLNDKLFFTIQNQLINSEPQFEIAILNGEKLKINLERVLKDTIDIEKDVYSGELAQNGVAKYILSLNNPIFTTFEIYELYVKFNNRQKIFRFEIIE